MIAQVLGTTAGLLIVVAFARGLGYRVVRDKGRSPLARFFGV